MPIRRLPPLLVNQIAAGEVVDRPASVVKELVENAIDAGATRIAITVEGGGRDLVQVVDDGAGIAFDELFLAVAAHATSKIREARDLDAIATMGFRGEALASIASVSRLELLSRPRRDDAAGRLEVEGGTARVPAPAAGPPGTTIRVRHLFFNTPARRKFLKGEATEYGRVLNTVQNLALAHPGIGFTLVRDGRTTLALDADHAPRQRAREVLGAELEPELLEVESRDEVLGIWGLIGRPSVARATARHMRVFLNGRPIADRAVNHAIREAYRGLIEPGRAPTVALFLEIDPAEVDVNVHPAKAEVRFRHPSAVHQRVLRTVRDGLRGADLVPAFDLRRGSHPVAFGASSRTATPAPAPSSDAGIVLAELREALARESAARSGPELPRVRHADEVLQVHATYLVTQDAEGLVIIDQHALHERVMFEKLRRRLDSGATLESQRLLVPATVAMQPAQIEHLETLKPLLERLGIVAEPMGPKTIAVHAFTTLLFERRVDPIDFIAELFDRFDRGVLETGEEAALHEVLDMMACKAAIKAGDRLSPAEMTDLLAQRESIERATNCPHGRPTTLRLSIADLEKQFGRR